MPFLHIADIFFWVDYVRLHIMFSYRYVMIYMESPECFCFLLSRHSRHSRKYFQFTFVIKRNDFNWRQTFNRIWNTTHPVGYDTFLIADLYGFYYLLKAMVLQAFYVSNCCVIGLSIAISNTHPHTLQSFFEVSTMK